MLLLFGLGNSIAINNLNHPHLSVSCRSCHSLQSGTGDNFRDSSVAQATSHCLECHGVALSEEQPRSVFHQTGDHCSSCHSFHKPSQIAIRDDSTTLARVQTDSVICEDCHNSTASPEITPGHRDAARLIHSGGASSFAGNPSAFCLTCHDATSGMVLASSEFVPRRLHMSASHTYDAHLTPGSQLPSSHFRIQEWIPETIRTVDGNMSCLSCHSLTSTNQRLLVTTIQDGLCTNCHDMQRSTGPAVFSAE